MAAMMKKPVDASIVTKSLELLGGSDILPICAVTIARAAIDIGNTSAVSERIESVGETMIPTPPTMPIHKHKSPKRTRCGVNRLVTKYILLL